MQHDQRSTQPGELAIDSVLDLILGPPSGPAPARPQDARTPAQRRLSRLLSELLAPKPARDPAETEDLIWALWISHPDPAAETAMADAVNALAAGEFARARPILDALVARHPDWAEAWNKRATLAFVEHRDADAVADIARTLALEPRHFGAVAGFGQICLRRGHLREARAAFTVALRLNPHLESVRERLADLPAPPTTLH